MKRVFSSLLELMRLQSEMNRIFEVLETLESEKQRYEFSYIPLYDIFETSDRIIVEIDIPGCEPESLSLTVCSNHLHIEGKIEKTQVKPLCYNLIERIRGKFRRTITINGAINTHKGVAVYKNGVLRIEFPKVEDRRGIPHHIPISFEENL